ncbi:MAG: slipin family protein [Planctomycetaceae bacterium]|nr:slipin family protein [Planctomycetaceae bacterium]
MFILKTIKIRSYEAGLYFRDDEFRGLLGAGRHWFVDPLDKTKVEVVSLRQPWLVHEKLDVIVKSGALRDRAAVLDLKDYERALVWIDGRFSQILPPGLYAYWTALREVRVEVVDARGAAGASASAAKHAVRFEHPHLQVILQSPHVERVLDLAKVEAHHVGVLFIDGEFVATLPPGRYAFWKNLAQVKFVQEDLREAMFDVAGQDIMTADKVTLRMNAIVTYRIVDARASVSTVEDVRQTLYREAQLALRAVVGARELDTFLTEKDGVADELADMVRTRAKALGVELIAVGIRDVILPGEMKDLMNKVTEAKKAAEANLIARREETAAIRSQANTAKLLTDNPTLMRLRELEILEKISANSKLNILLGEKGLADRVVNLL